MAEINGLTLNVRNLIRRRKLRKLLAESRTEDTPDTTGKVKCVRLPYLGNLSEKLATELRR